MQFRKLIFMLSLISLVFLRPSAFALQSGYFTYTVSGSTVTITGYTGTGGAVVIPSIIDNMPVASIGSSVFFHTITLTSVTIPDSVISIGSGAFGSCTFLTSLTIPNSVTSIGELAFGHCTGLTSVTIPASIASIGNIAFQGCNVLTSAYFYGNAPTLGSRVFDNCANGFTVYYLTGSSGFTNPWHGYTTAVFVPSTSTTTASIIFPTTTLTDTSSINDIVNNTSTDNSGDSFQLQESENNDQLTIKNNFNFNDPYDVTPASQPSGKVRIPVLTYHHLAPLPNNPKTRVYYVSPAIFEEQLQYLSAKNYRTLNTSEFIQQVKSGNNPAQKSVLITFDDGNYDNYKYAFPLLKKYGFVATFFVPSQNREINNKDLKAMVAAGMEVAPHGRTHMMLRKVNDSGKLYSELVSSKQDIANITGKTCESFCYPGCEYNSTVISFLANNGYQAAFSCGGGIDHRYKSRFALSRMHVDNDMGHFKSIFSGG